ncbi:hypothetical protein [Lacticaseibacillus paracasei]|uniref:hypothetical protein n=1 Tax=Lacticaseibacillus paracasei TaxID=1597 RepID=UPI000FF836E6|nr:hypothetical protein [Lacticaseibacillus paracasei]RND69147.1 hypothetical protein FAM18132_02615 [Lacticaseibacillus paracasei]
MLINEKYNNLIKQRDKAEKKIEQADFKARQSKYYESQKKRKAHSRRLIQKGLYLKNILNQKSLVLMKAKNC